MASSDKPTRTRRIDKAVVHKVDRSIWRPSYPDGYMQGHAVADALLGRRQFYFRKVRRVRRLWLHDYWQDTGEVWQPSSGEFDVVSNDEAVAIIEGASNDGE